MKFILPILILLFYASAFAIEPNEQRLETISNELQRLAQRDSSLCVKIDISTGKMTLSELLRNVAKASGVNISIKRAGDITIASNFTGVKVCDLIFFLCKDYNLDIDIIGNIISIFPAPEPVVEIPRPKISHRIYGNTLTYNLSEDLLPNVIKQINSLTGTNILIPQSLAQKRVSGYVGDLELDDAISTLASTNGMGAYKDPKGIWSYSEENQSNAARIAPSFVRSTQFTANQLSVDSLGMVSATIGRGNIQDIIIELCNKLNVNYFFLTPLNTQTSIYLNNISFDELLSVMLSGTPYSYYIENGIYIFGSSSASAKLSSVKVIPIEYRSVNKMIGLIPDNIKAELQLKDYPDINSIIASGDQRQISRVENFLRSIDRKIPLVTIEIMIVDAKKTRIVETGLGLGVGKSPTTTSGTLAPGVNMTLGASSINSLLNSFNGFGSINLGNVSQNLYANLQLLEEDGIIELQSTPKLATLNGNEASLKSGETQYYKEITNNFIGSMNPIQSESFQWKSVEANLNIKIIPYVSKDNHITLEIEIEQSEFTPRIEKDAPPGITTRTFKSIVKVNDEDTVLLGGIDRNTMEKSSSGLPLIARIPVLKWIFGHNKNNKTTHRLNVFIKPTVVQ